MQYLQTIRRGGLYLAAFVCVVVTALAFAQPAMARMSDFTGNWVNVDRRTDNLTRVQIHVLTFTRVQVHAFGQCHPTDCDWGTVLGVYRRGMGESVMADFDSGFSRTRLVLHRASGGRLRYDMHVRFTDNSGRAPYDRHGLLERPRANGGGRPHPGPGGNHASTLGSEDCLSEPWSSLAVARAGGRWKITHGSEWVLDFGSNKAAADRSLRIIRHYRFDQICYVKRPHAPMVYWKRNGNVPRGNMAGQDCINFNPHTATVSNAGGGWKVVQGGMSLLYYGSDKAAADKALAVIKHYNLNRQCFVARPNPPMQYYLAE